MTHDTDRTERSNRKIHIIVGEFTNLLSIIGATSWYKFRKDKEVLNSNQFVLTDVLEHLA